MVNPKLLIFCFLSLLFLQCQFEKQKNNESTNSIQDSLNLYLLSKQSLPKEMSERLFDTELLESDKLLIKEIRPKLNSLNPIITVFHTVEEDSEKQYTELTLFNEEWKRLHSFAIEYEMPWDLFRQEYKFINDSTLELIEYNEISYDNDSTVKTTHTVQLDKTNGLDTLKTEIDTLRN